MSGGGGGGGGVGLLYAFLSVISVVLGGCVMVFIGLLRLNNGAKVASYFQLLSNGSQNITYNLFEIGT